MVITNARPRDGRVSRTVPARVLGRDHSITEGAPARLIVYSTRTVRELLGEHVAPRYVVYDGKVVAKEGTLV